MTITSPWAATLLPASWNGVPFVVTESRIVRGRRTALHEYPLRDTVYVEDLGRGTRRYDFRGFLVGDDVFAQRDAMVAAAEFPGAGVLVHPSLGSISASLISFSAGESAERGRVVELDFTFIENGQQLFPVLARATVNAVASAAAGLQASAAADFALSTATILPLGGPVIAAASSVVVGFTANALRLAADPSLAARAVNGLNPPPQSDFSRYSAGARSAPQPATATTSSALAATVSARASLSSSAAAANTKAAAL